MAALAYVPGAGAVAYSLVLGSGGYAYTGNPATLITTAQTTSKSGVNRLWLIEYYTKEFAKKEELRKVTADSTAAATKRNASKKAVAERAATIERLALKAEADLAVLTQGIKDAAVAQRFTQALIQQAAVLPEPEIDFLQVAQAYRKRMREEDDELLLLAFAI